MIHDTPENPRFRRVGQFSTYKVRDSRKNTHNRKNSMALRRRVNRGRFVRVVDGMYRGYTGIVSGELSQGGVRVYLIQGNRDVIEIPVLLDIVSLRVAPRTAIHNRKIGKAILKGMQR